MIERQILAVRHRTNGWNPSTVWICWAWAVSVRAQSLPDKNPKPFRLDQISRSISTHRKRRSEERGRREAIAQPNPSPPRARDGRDQELRRRLPCRLRLAPWQIPRAGGTQGPLLLTGGTQNQGQDHDHLHLDPSLGLHCLILKLRRGKDQEAMRGRLML